MFVIITIFLLILILGWKFFTYPFKKRCTSTARVDGKTVIVTGANRGIGFGTAMEMAQRGAKVILACRNVDAANEAASKIITKTGNQQVTVMKLDLTSFASIRNFVHEFNKNEKRLDILINNASLVGPETRQLTEDGNEIQFQSNHLGPFLLTNLLVPILRKSAPSRIINVSSIAHLYVNNLDLDNLNSEKAYQRFRNYSRSKLCNVLFTIHLSNLMKGTKVTVNALHPGFVSTQIMDSYYQTYNIKSLCRFLFQHSKFIVRDEDEGAQTIILVAVDPDLEDTSGKYFDNCEMTKPSSLALDSKLSQKLWDISAHLCKMSDSESSHNLKMI